MFGIEILDASLAPALLIALLGGLISFASPCVLPIVPPYLAYMAGTGQPARSGDRRVILAASFFVLGLSTVFILLGLSASALGNLFVTYRREFGLVAGGVIILFGLHFLGILRIGLLYREARFEASGGTGSPLGAYLLGLAFAFGWTPCIGPILSAILSMAAQDGTLERGMLLMAVYALGLGLPFLLAAIFLDQFVAATAPLRRHMGKIEKAMGVLLILVGLMMATGLFSEFSYWLLDLFPGLALIG